MTDWLTFNYKIGTDFYSKDVKSFFEKGSNAYSDGRDLEANSISNDFNADFTATISKRLKREI